MKNKEIFSIRAMLEPRIHQIEGRCQVSEVEREV
jgi:hypothetical protein